MKIKKRCDKCEELRTNMTRYKDKYYCKPCFLKVTHLMVGHKSPLSEELSYKRLENKTVRKNCKGGGIIFVPKMFVGKKVKVVVLE